MDVLIAFQVPGDPGDPADVSIGFEEPGLPADVRLLAEESIGRVVRGRPLLLVTHARIERSLPDESGRTVYRLSFGCSWLDVDRLNALPLDGEGRRALYPETRWAAPRLLG